ncbi:hypothetical protein BJV78DRAFT_1153602 [Lactifluus subvellereus]|nr:hypothetical protein BJV78DRAFT_1153602 [Lactifluus subvellereus]
MPGATHPPLVATYTVSNPLLAPGPLHPVTARVSDAAPSCSTPVPGPSSHQPCIPPTCISLLHVLLECLEALRVPTVLELLALMDAEDPAPNLKYMDIQSELSDHNIKDMIELYSLPVELLATFGDLGMDGASRLHRYVEEKMLTPLDLLKTKGSNVGSSVVEIAKEEVAMKGSVARQATSSNDKGRNAPIQPTRGLGQKAILEWLEGVRQGELDIEEVIELETDADEVEVDADEDEVEMNAGEGDIDMGTSPSYEI